jgi:hypothetical protein
MKQLASMNSPCRNFRQFRSSLLCFHQPGHGRIGSSESAISITGMIASVFASKDQFFQISISIGVITYCKVLDIAEGGMK